jgi:hypothetical protein
MTRKEMIRVAKLEIAEWETCKKGKPYMPHGLVLVILFAFIHRLTTGETVEETFFTEPTWSDYEI